MVKGLCALSPVPADCHNPKIPRKYVCNKKRRPQGSGQI